VQRRVFPRVKKICICAIAKQKMSQQTELKLARNIERCDMEKYIDTFSDKFQLYV
jgi:hypothetical protein